MPKPSYYTLLALQKPIWRFYGGVEPYGIILPVKRILQHMAVAMYIAATISGLLFTLFRITLPGVPGVLSQWSFGMLAPFQNYLTYNEELVALGRNADESWKPIDLNPYLPYGKGERSIRSYLSTYHKWPPEELTAKYREYAKQIQTCEAERGRLWDELRLELHRWPRSPEGYSALRLTPFIHSTPLTHIP